MATVDTHVLPGGFCLKTFFEDAKTDIDFLKKTTKQITARSTQKISTGSQLRFEAEALKGPKAYILKDIILRVEFEIVLKSGESLPSDGTTVLNMAMVNNTLHSFISSLQFYMGDTQIGYGNNYNMGCYMRSVLSYDNMYKSSVLQSSGWFPDVAGEMETTTASNSGFDSRRDWFLNPPVAPATNFTPNASTKTLIGRLMTPMSGASAPCPPGVSFGILIEVASRDFLIFRSLQDDHEYDIKFNHFDLFVPIAELNPDLYAYLMTKWTLQNRVRIHYRRYVTNSSSIPSNNSFFRLNLNRAGSELPSRIALGFIRANDVYSQKRNPYNFRRVFREASKPDSDDVYISKIRVFVSGERLDQLPDTMSKKDASGMFHRMNEVNGFSQSASCNSITMKEFANGYFFACYDFSVGKNAYDNEVHPTVRTGELDLEILFSEPIPFEIYFYALCEYPCTSSIGPNGQVSNSF